MCASAAPRDLCATLILQLLRRVGNIPFGDAECSQNRFKDFAGETHIFVGNEAAVKERNGRWCIVVDNLPNPPAFVDYFNFGHQLERRVMSSSGCMVYCPWRS